MPMHTNIDKNNYTFCQRALIKAISVKTQTGTVLGDGKSKSSAEVSSRS